MSKKKDAKPKDKKTKKVKGIRVEFKSSGGPSFKLPPEIGERLAAAGAELQTRAEAVFSQWLDQASLTLRKSGVQSLVKDIKSAGKQFSHSEARESFEKVAKTLASTVANEITKFAMSATIAKANAPKTAAAATARTAKPAAKTANKSKPAAKKPAAKAATKAKPASAKAPAKTASTKKPVVKAAAKRVAAAKPVTKPAMAKKPASKTAARRKAPRPSSRATTKK